ncbi:hypothetical protein EDM02_01340 [Candidatus Cardinium hertigii]|uniref:Uncharacterized protein n=2 Tax=Candidatus Cardinium hertigii TaxID=247481 RepID=A0A3N2QCZ6_9BACT|nr:hypothetical protein EDM02_01340 [Candidatus Cardinium hertigii]
MIRRLMAIIVATVFPTTYCIYNGYTQSTAPSNFELAASQLGFNGYEKANVHVSAADQQEALLKQLQMAGYFTDEQLWRTLIGLGIQQPELAFKQLSFSMQQSKANQRDPNQFIAKILRKNLGKQTILDTEDMLDFILYTAQNAFGRAPGQERNTLCTENWMQCYQQAYVDNARILRLIDREVPLHKDYDSVWIAGASRFSLITRMVDYYYALLRYTLHIHGDVLVLAGNRELFANLDGVTPLIQDKLIEAYKTHTDVDTLDFTSLVEDNNARIEEGKAYILKLGAQCNIRLDPLSPFIQYTNQEACPPGRFPGRVYPNYAKGKSRKLTETVMVQNVIATFFDTKSVQVIDTATDRYKRPTTATTARDAAIAFMERIGAGTYGDKKEFVILYVTNNPYIERQTLSSQGILNKVVADYNRLHHTAYRVRLEGIGCKCQQNIARIHSEFAALIAEKWQKAYQGKTTKRAIEDLQFQHRNHLKTLPPIPGLSKEKRSITFFQHLFDVYLP